MKAVSAVLGVTTVMTLLLSLAGESRAGLSAGEAPPMRQSPHERQ